MRRLTTGSLFVPAMLLAACGADTIQAPLSPATTAYERQGQTLPESFDYTTIDFHDALGTVATLTSAQGINADGDVVGFYDTPDKIRHGFLRRDGVFTTIDFPSSAGRQVVSTDARGIGPGGDIVGGYQLAGEPAVNIHGYRLTAEGQFVAADYPGHTNTIPQRILPDGTILGCRHDGDTMGTMRGVVMSRHGNAELDVMASMNNGATPDGHRIAGLYTPAGELTFAGYVVEDGVFTPFRIVAGKLTAAWDMSPSGQIAGVYADAAGHVHGFVRSGNDHVTLDMTGVDGVTATRAFGINASGDVVGAYVAGGKTHAYLATPIR